MRALIIAALLASPAAADPLTAIVGDRVAGTPVDCIQTNEIDKVHIVQGAGVVYEMRAGRVMYLNRPTSGLNFLHDDDILAVENGGSRLCSVEPVRVLNPNSRLPIATLTLGKFVPYRRPVAP